MPLLNLFLLSEMTEIIKYCTYTALSSYIGILDLSNFTYVLGSSCIPISGADVS